MARVTVEDCLERVENRFALVHLTTQRTKQLKKGKKPLVTCDNREIVTALREIADGSVGSISKYDGAKKLDVEIEVQKDAEVINHG